MAKISARGATELARFTVRTNDNPSFDQVFVLTSDGRVLRKYVGEGFNVYGRIKDEAKRTGPFLKAILERRGYRVIKEGK